MVEASLEECENVRVEDVQSLAYIPTINQITYLKKLNLSSCNLSILPDSIGLLQELQMLNLMNNKLEKLPDSLGNLSKVTLLGLKSNKLVELPESMSGMRSLKELYLTDNQLVTLPNSFSSLTSLVKLQASFNKFESLSSAISSLPCLEMMRFACCNIASIPENLICHEDAFPALAWVSLAGNPCCPLPSLDKVLTSVRRLSKSEIQIGASLGSGASGEVFAVDSLDPVPEGLPPVSDLAVKFFVGGSGGVSPDGRLDDEVLITTLLGSEGRGSETSPLNLRHFKEEDGRGVLGNGKNGIRIGDGSDPDSAARNLVQCVLASVESGGRQMENGSEGKRIVEGLLFRRFTGVPLALKPSSAHLLRCRWAEDKPSFPSPDAAVRLTRLLARALGHCHGYSGHDCHGFCHGDIYAHNVLATPELSPTASFDDLDSSSDGSILLCDFGASFPYPTLSSSGAPPSTSPSPTSSPLPSLFFWESVEVRAFGLLLKDIAERVPLLKNGSEIRAALLDLATECVAPKVWSRPSFRKIHERVQEIENFL